MPGCDGTGTTERSYPASKVGGAAERSYPASEVRGSDERSYPVSEVRGGSRENQPHAQGAMAARAQEDVEELFHVQGQEGQR